MRALIVAAIFVVAEPLASAQPAPTPQPADAPEPVEDAPNVPRPDELAARIEELEARQETLEAKQRKTAGTHEQVQSLLPLRRFITVFIDVGAFAVGGDGSGIRPDLGHLYYPRYRDRLAGEWTFMGDPLSTAINSLGEPADTATSRELHDDTVDSRGHASLIVSSVGLAIGKDVSHGISVASLVELLPRPGHDILDIELAHIDYRPSNERDLLISLGKIDSVLGVEYRSQDAPRRLGVTPSLICRYTCGRPLGVSARLVDGRLSASASITNGDNFEERFEPHLLKASVLPTVAGHLQWMLPLGQGLEVGASGAVGPQDNQRERSTLQWHVGFDLRLRDLDHFDVAAEYVQGLQQGRTTTDIACNDAPCLRYKGAYVLVDRRMNAWLTPYVRVDWRDAVHQSGVDFVYESHTLRSTLGAHVELTSRILAKLEYTFNRELGAGPEFPDDVLTSSVVVATD